MNTKPIYIPSTLPDKIDLSASGKAYRDHTPPPEFDALAAAVLEYVEDCVNREREAVTKAGIVAALERAWKEIA